MHINHNHNKARFAISRVDRDFLYLSLLIAILMEW